jgi:hypothetical protein
MPDCYQIRVNNQRLCSGWKDNGYKDCAEWRDNGYSACATWDKNCCTWVPCSWGCRLFTWICVGFVWINNLACVAYVWIANVVCVAWVWVTYVVCIFPELVLNGRLWIQWQVIQMLRCINPKDTERNPIEKPGWTLTFQDDFDKGAIDYSKWSDGPYHGSRYDGSGLSKGIFPLVYFSPVNFAFSASTIKLIADNQPKTIPSDPNFNGPFTIPYTAGYLGFTGERPVGALYGPFDQLYGFFEIRCKIPGTPYQWPAFWLASRASWPPEIDIFEFFTTNNTDRFSSTHHWGKDSGGRHPMQGADHRVCGPSDYFHIYACEWTSTQIRWYCDNHLIRVSSDGIGDFTYKMHVIVNTSIQGGTNAHPENSTYPNYFEVDYVRAYKR